MPGYNHYADCTCGWCRGGGGGGGYRVTSSAATLPAAGTRSTWESDDFCRPTTCPICGAEVFFVRHNGGSVWFDELGPPWPKHSCFFDDISGIRLRAHLRPQPAEAGRKFFGIVVETVVVEPGKSARFIVRCSDGSTIDDVFTTSANVVSYPGALVVIEKYEDGKIRLSRITGEQANIEVWRFPRLGVVLVYDPRMQDDVEDHSSRFWVWKENRWTILRDFNVQPQLAAVTDDEAVEVIGNYLDESSYPPRNPVPTVFARLFGKAGVDIPIDVQIFPGTPLERSFKLPASYTADQKAEWIKKVEAIRAPRKINAEPS